MDGTVLVADDDRTIRTVLTQALTRAGCKVRATSNAAQLWRWVEDGEGDAVISDVMMPDGNGLDLLPAIQRKRPDLPVIIISAQNTVVTAIRASEVGAFDYVPKPFDLRELLSKVSRALKQSGQPNRVNDRENGASLIPLVGGSPAMQEVYRLLARFVNSDLNVMIMGESGTGKDLVARTLHDLGNRSSNRFLRINCATATTGHLDAAVLSNGGDGEDRGGGGDGAIIYLDGLGEMALECQSHLLGLIQSAPVQSLGMRFVSSSIRPITPLINEGLFREDLFYRLNVMPITLPPLRQRIEDIPDLCRHFLKNCTDQNQHDKTITKSAFDLMRRATWQGNVRALKNLVQRLVTLSVDDEIDAAPVAAALHEMAQHDVAEPPLVSGRLSASVEAHIKRYFDQHGESLPPSGLYNRILSEVELPLIALSLNATRGNQIKTSELLGINRNTLRKKIRELDIQVTRSKKLM